MKNINIWLCRHGQSVGNTVDPDVIGQPENSPLTETGVKQAKLLGKFFLDRKTPFDDCSSSSFIRAASTAQIITSVIGYNDPLYLYKELVEYSPGDWRGRVRADVLSVPENIRRLNTMNMGFRFPNGEALVQTERRATQWIEDKIVFNDKVLAAAENDELNFLVVSHGMTIRCLLHYIMGFDQSFIWKMHIDNCSITHLIFGDRGWGLRMLNGTAHLGDMTT